MAKGPPPHTPAAGETQVIDLADVDLVLPEELRRVAPPPLPPDEIARASQLPSAAPPAPSTGPVATEPPPARSSRVYVVVLAACLVTCALAGLAIAKSMRSSPAPAPAASGRVITISPVEMNDDVDGGK